MSTATYKLKLHHGSNKYRVHLTELTMNNLKSEIAKITKTIGKKNLKMKITDGEGYRIETDEHIQAAFEDAGNDSVDFTVCFANNENISKRSSTFRSSENGEIRNNSRTTSKKSKTQKEEEKPSMYEVEIYKKRHANQKKKKQDKNVDKNDESKLRSDGANSYRDIPKRANEYFQKSHNKNSSQTAERKEQKGEKHAGMNKNEDVEKEEFDAFTAAVSSSEEEDEDNDDEDEENKEEEEEEEEQEEEQEEDVEEDVEKDVEEDEEEDEVEEEEEDEEEEETEETEEEAVAEGEKDEEEVKESEEKEEEEPGKEDASWNNLQETPKYLKNDALQMYSNYKELKQLSQQLFNEKQKIKMEKMKSKHEIDNFYQQISNELQEWKLQALTFVDNTYDKSMNDLDLSIERLHTTIQTINTAYTQAMSQHSNDKRSGALATIRTVVVSKSDGKVSFERPIVDYTVCPIFPLVNYSSCVLTTANDIQTQMSTSANTQKSK